MQCVDELSRSYFGQGADTFSSDRQFDCLSAKKFSGDPASLVKAMAHSLLFIVAS